MPDGPKRKKRPAERPGRIRKKRIPSAATPRPHELDLRTLLVLSVGEWWELADHEWPPDRICRWLAEADPRQLRGLLLATLERWHDLAIRDCPLVRSASKGIVSDVYRSPLPR